MRKTILLAALAAAALPGAAARRLTVTQLEETLSADIAAHRADTDMAHRVGDVELSERLTAATLDHFAARLAIGPRTALALELLADRSAFLDPPASELPATEPPDAAAQQRMMDAARGWVIATVPRLPNFFATRTTNRFDDGPQVLNPGDWPVRAGLHLAGTISRQITFRDGKEVLDAAAEPAAGSQEQAQQELGLHTIGEFGPELSIVLSDTAKGQVTWSHWEQTPAGLAAVFRYEVPRAASHYAVNYCCIRDQEFVERRDLRFNSRNQSPQQMATLAKTDASQSFRDTPGYHGSIFVDPATGAILRITLEAELKESDPISRAQTVVEYGPVKIGEDSYICPVRSLAISMEPAVYKANGEPRSPATLLINETSFTHYHRLGTTIRMLADNGAPGAGAAGAGDSSAPAGSAPPAATAATGEAQADAKAPAGGTAVAANLIPPPPGSGAAAEAPPGTPSPPPPPPEPVIPEVTLNAAGNLPDRPAAAPEPQPGGVTLKVTSRLVDVGVVVYDKKGRPVRDLKQDDFEVYDNGRKQEVRFFSEFTSAAPVPAAPAATAAAKSAQDSAAPAEQSFSNRAPDAAGGGAATSTAAAQQDATILLIDESHIAWADLSNARQQMLKFLKAAPPDARIGLYIITPFGFKVLKEITSDHAAIMARLEKWMPTAQAVSQAQEEEVRNRQQFNEVQNVSDLGSVNGNLADTPDGGSPVDPQLLTMGDNPARASLIILGGVARHLSAVPGHKSLIWISSDNVFADFRDQAVGIDKSSKYIDSYALHAQEAMNDAHVAVYPFDVSQLEGAAITADMQHRNVELTQAGQDSAALALAGAAASGRGGSAPGGGGGRDMTPGRVTAEMNQDLHPIQGPIRQVADATGGRTIRRAGDMAAEMAEVTAEGNSSYMISFRPDTNADNQYHNLTVKLNGKRGLSARYRTGYFYAQEPATLKERFQQAVWLPTDANEVAVTAGVDKMESGANVKIDIAAGDLGMEERAGRWMDKLDIFFIQRDDAGIHAQVEGQTLGLRLKPATYQRLLPSGVPFEHEVRLRPGTASLRVLVVDENSGRMGSVTIPAEALGGGQ
jgi:VWFA-related protein